VGEGFVYLAPSELSHLLSALERGYASTYGNAREMVIKILAAMRENLDIVLVEPASVLVGLGPRSRKIMSFLSWYSMRYAEEVRRSVFFVSRVSEFSNQPPFVRYIEPWVHALAEAAELRGRFVLKIEHSEGVEVWEY